MNKKTFEELKSELYNKIRTVKDISRYIDKKDGGAPNYNVFLGAGASVTSQISSGGNLVEEWRNEIFLHECKDIDHDNILNIPDANERKDKIRHELIKLPGGWYNPQNEYSSLFEKKFDLPSQRRRFVEAIVDDKLPSIGYLYLVSLINKNYFNTVFTTNFDDLINESFYHFSDVRPYVCAHDSSIGSLSVLNKRPKIIKLHGDYLFDDIKNTLKETESLEINTREKFIEFSKDGGIIIVGYSGQDRSIMDVLNYLVQQEEYLKNGIYWCFRKNDEISQDLRKLLWRDKVYCIEIDGFDEFFAELSSELKCQLSFKDTDINSKRDKCLKILINDKFNLRSNSIIDKDIGDLENDNFNKDISNLIREINANSVSNISPNELKIMLEVESLIELKEFDRAIQTIEDFEQKESVENFNMLKIKIYKLSKQFNKGVALIDELILQDPFNIKYYFIKASMIDKIEDRLSYLISCDDKVKHSFSLLNTLVSESLNYHDIYNKEYDGLSLDDALLKIEDSLNLDSSLDNDAYLLKYKIFKKQFDFKSLKVDLDLIYKKIEDLLKDMENINRVHTSYLNIKSDFISIKNEKKDFLDFNDEVLNIVTNVSNEKKQKVYDVLSQSFVDYYTSKKNAFLENGELLDDFFYKKDLSFKEKSSDFLLNKAVIEFSKKGDMCSAFLICKRILEKEDAHLYFYPIVKLIAVEKNSIILDYLKDKIEKIKNKLDPKDYILSLTDILEVSGDYNDSLGFLLCYLEFNKDESLVFIKIIFNYISLERYDDAIKFYFDELGNVKNFKQFNRDIFELNYFLAKKNNKTLKEEDKVKIRNISTRNSKDKHIAIACNNLLGVEQSIVLNMKDMVECDYRSYYMFMKWPIIETKYKDSIKSSFSHKLKTVV